VGCEQVRLVCEDGVELWGRLWLPQAEPRAVVCLVHGLGEHSGRYEHVALAFAARGHGMLNYDLRGHGHSPGARGDAPSFEHLVSDVGCCLGEARARFPTTPRFLYGHSLGGMLSLDYALRHKPALAGLIVTSPGLRNSLEQQQAKLLLVGALGLVLPHLALPTGLNPEHISRDQSVVRAYVEDPLVHNRMTLGMARGSLAAIAYIYAHARHLSVPTLLMQGSDDQLGLAIGSKQFAELASDVCTYRVWDGLCHELHNEPEKEKVLQAILKWMDERLASA
jgi:alpha-beta hydrolase superfamily lysophospholipase